MDEQFSSRDELIAYYEENYIMTIDSIIEEDNTISVQPLNERSRTYVLRGCDSWELGWDEWFGEVVHHDQDEFTF